MLKIGVLGAGHLGKVHLKLLNESPNFNLVGYFDPHENNIHEKMPQILAHRFATVDELLDEVDAVDIVTPTISHYDCAVKALKKFKHIFIEKPITNTIHEAKSLIELSKEANVKVQVGHVERFNPAFVAAKPYLSAPMFIEAHRLSSFTNRGTDVPVVLDLMIHDIDIVLSVVKSPIKKIHANGVAVVSNTPDIANVRIEFHNGCVANLTASRISLQSMRKVRFFQRDAYITVDFLKKESGILKMKDINKQHFNGSHTFAVDLGQEKGVKEMYFYKPEVTEINAIQEELESFGQAIEADHEPIVSINDGYNALHVAHQIIKKLKLSSDFLKNN